MLVCASHRYKTSLLLSSVLRPVTGNLQVKGCSRWNLAHAQGTELFVVTTALAVAAGTVHSICHHGAPACGRRRGQEPGWPLDTFFVMKSGCLLP